MSRMLPIPCLDNRVLQDDPLNNECAQHYKDNEKDAMRVSKEYTQKYAV